jgi:hypothetical protein
MHSAGDNHAYLEPMENIMFYEVTILGQSKSVEQKSIVLVGEPIVVHVDEKKEEVVELTFEEVDDTELEEQIKRQEKEMTEEEAILAEVVKLQAELAALKNPTASTVASKGDKVQKNHKPVKPQDGRTYELLSASLKTWGKVPQQQLDLAKLVVLCFGTKDTVTEAELFAFLTLHAGGYESIRKSVQHVTYLFAYYRGLRNDGKHAGFIARNFLRVSN